MKYEIRSKEYFKGFADKKVLGRTPAEHLSRKLESVGYKLDGEGMNVFYDDMFYLDPFILAKGPDSAAGMHEDIHTGIQFHNAVRSLMREINIGLINAGVEIMNINETYIDAGVRIESGTKVYPNTHITGDSHIGRDCIIGPDSILDNTVAGDGCEVIKSVIKDSSMGRECRIGPFSHIRPGNKLGDRVKVGAYAEVKNSNVSDKTVIPHLAYVGDSDVGRNCNISCGVITANYDGKIKSRTTIGDNAFVGCNTTLIAPVEVDRDTYIAAGSTITDDVPEGSLSIARNRQLNKAGWVEKTGRKRKEKD